MDDEARLKLQAKRFNEHVKLFVTTLNVIALTIFGAGVLQPLITSGSGATPIATFNMIWIALSIALHFVAQGLIRLIQLDYVVMNQLPLWPPILALALGLAGYAFFWFWARRLHRDEEESRRTRHPAE